MSQIIADYQDSLNTENLNINKAFASIDEIIQDIKQGKMFILVDSEDRENEGDFIVCSELANEAQISQMIRYGSGIVYLVLDEEKKEKLGLNLLRKTGKASMDELHVKFLEPIEASFGISTGISAKDRLTTIKAASAMNATQKDIITPGHVLTILAHPMGLSARHGHTEASNTLMKLAGFSGCAVGCEVMKDNGEMARIPDLIKIANFLDLNICAIKDLLEFIKN